MRLCHIVPSLEERHGGPSKSVHALAAALAEEGHETELLATAPGAGEVTIAGQLATRTFRRNWPQRFCPSAGLREYLASVKADVIHHHSLWLRTLHYAHRRSAGTGASLVLSPRGMMSPWAWRHHRHRKRLARAMVHPGAIEAVDGWHATSADEADDIRALGFTQPICVAPNGVNAPDPSAIQQAAEFWRAACPAVEERPVALFYSRFHQKKRVLELIDLWLEHGPRDWLLLVVGIPQDYTPEMLEAYVLRASGAGRVRVFSGIRRPPPYAVANLFLLPSHSENFGLVVAEAMAHGVPALVTDTMPWSELNADGYGWCVPWPDFAAALRIATSEDDVLLHRRGERASAWVLREFSWAKSAQILAAFYQELKETGK